MPKNRQKLRSGFTTGACAAVTARAAWSLLAGKKKALTLIDGYAFYRVHQSSEHWLSGMFSFSEPLSQLAIILAINIAVIIILLIYIAHKR
jgi:hypothetical protein